MGEKRKKDPNAPKRGMSAYFFYMNENRERIKSDNPGATFGQIGKIAGEEWNAMSDDAKEPFQVKARKDKERYEREMEGYVPPPETKSGKRKKKDPNAPKRPQSAYFMFMNENRDRIKEENPEAGFGDIGKIAGSEWKEMDDDDKAPYARKAAKDKERYERQMEAYNGEEE